MSDKFIVAVVALCLAALPNAAKAQAADAIAAPQLADTAALRQTSPHRYPGGVWRSDHAPGLGAPPLFFMPLEGSCAANRLADDAGSCVDATDGNSWRARGDRLDAREFGVDPRAGDATAQAQAALDAAYGLGTPGPVYFPTEFNFTRLATYPEVKIIGGGCANRWRRIAVGPGLYTVLRPGDSYPTAPVRAPAFADLCIDGGGHAGTNLLLASALDWRIDNSHFLNSGSGAQFSASIKDRVLTVTAVNRGRINVGDRLFGVGIGYPDDNGAITIVAAGSGSGGRGTYTISGAGLSVDDEPMFTADSWAWTNAEGRHTLPSANETLLGSTQASGVFDGLQTRSRTAGVYNAQESACVATSAIGLYLDTTRRDGTQKPNGNLFESLYPFCNTAGIVVQNGSDNTFVNVDLEELTIGVAIGLGPGGAYRNIVIQPYLEGLEGSPMAVGIMLGRQGQQTTVIGTGSGSTVSRLIQDGGGHNRFVANNDQTLSAAALIDNFDPGLKLPAPRITASHLYNGSDGGAVELGILTHGNAGDIACGHTDGSNAAPTAVAAGEILCSFGAWGQYDDTPGHYSALTAGIDVQAAGGWTAASWPTHLLLSTTPSGSTTKSLRFTLGAGLYAQGLRDPGPGGVNARSISVEGVALRPALSATSGAIGGTPLAAAECASGTASVAKAAIGMAVVATPDLYPGDGAWWEGYVSAPGVVTVKLCARIALTPAASTYSVRVIQ